MTDATLRAALLAEDRNASKNIKGVGDEADRTADKLDGLGEKGTAALEAIGIGGGLALGAGIASSLNLDAANDKLAGQLGVGAAKAEQLGETAGALYSGAFGDSMEQVNEAIKLVVQNIDGMADASQADLQAISADVLTVASTFDEDLGGITRAVSQLMRNGLAPNAEAALDIITKGLQNGTNKSEDLLDTFNEYSTMFRELGLNGKESLGLMSQGLQAGARDADTVADALKEFAIRGQDGSKSTALAFEELGLNFRKMELQIAKGGPTAKKSLDVVLDRLRKIKDPAQRAQLAVALFGTKAEDLGDALYALDLDTAADGLGKVEGATKDMSDTVNDNALTSITELKRELEQAFVNTVGGKVIPFMEEHKTLVVAVGSVLAALAVTVMTVSAAMSAWAAVTKVWTGIMVVARNAQIAFNIAMMANPVGVVILALVALGAALVVAYKKSETFRTIVDAAFRAIGEALRFVWNNFLAPVFQFWSYAIGTILATWAQLLRLLGKVPGFGWAKDLADKLDTAADAAKNLDLKLHDAQKPRKIKIDTSAIERASSLTHGLLTLLASAMENAPKVGGGSGGRTSSNAVGTDFFAGGFTSINERGPEIIWLPRGSAVSTAAESERLMSGGGGDVTGVIEIIVKSETGEVIERKLTKLKRLRGGQQLEFV